MQECRLNRQRDASAFGSRLVDGIRGSYICKPPVSVRHAAFVIKHYAQDVTYSVDGLIEKNKVRNDLGNVSPVMMSNKQFSKRT